MISREAGSRVSLPHPEESGSSRNPAEQLKEAGEEKAVVLSKTKIDWYGLFLINAITPSSFIWLLSTVSKQKHTWLA